MKRMRILCVIGTRPEGVKMAPVILALQRQPWADVRVLTTAQHRELLDEVLQLFSIRPDVDLDLMQPGQSLAGLTSRLASALDEVLDSIRPDMVVAQGDTTTVMMAALCSFYRRVPFAHVEAGLRTHDRSSPFPEEANRVIAGYLSDLHFAPTETARQALLAEGVDANAVLLTGNTVIDALQLQVQKGHVAPVLRDIPEGRRLLLVTAHRRENFGAPMERIAHAIRSLLDGFEDVHVVCPVHPNPNVGPVIRSALQDHGRATLCEPLGYADFVSVMERAYLILTDSGGVQEEAPALGKPVLVLREQTERPEAVEAGVAELVGTDRDRIVTRARQLLEKPELYRAMARGTSPYGDGEAAARIVLAIREFLELRSTPAGSVQ